MPVLNVDIETMMNELMNVCIECRYRNYDEWVDEFPFMEFLEHISICQTANIWILQIGGRGYSGSMKGGAKSGTTEEGYFLE